MREQTLNDVMEFDHVVRIHSDGTVSDGPANVYAPALYAPVDADGHWTSNADSDLERQAYEAGWTLLSGHTGQYGYNGPVMHASEFIGGGLESFMLETPGLYVVVAVETDGDATDGHAGWAIAYSEL